MRTKLIVLLAICMMLQGCPSAQKRRPTMYPNRYSDQTMQQRVYSGKSGQPVRSKLDSQSGLNWTGVGAGTSLAPE